MVWLLRSGGKLQRAGRTQTGERVAESVASFVRILQDKDTTATSKPMAAAGLAETSSGVQLGQHESDRRKESRVQKDVYRERERDLCELETVARACSAWS